jgi:predicted porin
VAIIGRVDDVNPDTDVADDRRTRIIAGASYQVSPNLRLLADIDHVTFEGGAQSPAVEASSSQALFQIGLTF